MQASDSYSPMLLPMDQAIQAFDALAVSSAQEIKAMNLSGIAALSMAMSGLAGDPGREVKDDKEKNCPLLLAVLGSLYHERAFFFHDDPNPSVRHKRRRVPIPRVSVSLNPTVPFPDEAFYLSARERLAFVLLRAGADPWAKDPDGLDAMDWAVRTQSRSLFQALLSHHGCPPLEQIKGRTTTHLGREVPWLHSLAYFSGIEMISDLKDLGWNMEQEDKNGWPPAAWVNTDFTLDALLSPLSPLQRSAQRPVLEKAWTRRKNMKLVVPSFRQENLAAALAPLAAASAKDRQDVMLFQMMEGWLSGNPAQQSYKYKGVKFGEGQTSAQSPPLQEFVDRFDWRFEKKSGSARGSWSMLSASAWGVVRGEQSKKADHAFITLLENTLHSVSSQARKAWLQEEIRPGMSNQGLVCWALGGLMSAPQRELMSCQKNEREARQERLESAANAARAMCSGNLSEQARKQIESRVHDLWVAEQIGSAREPWVWPVLGSLADKGLFFPTLEVYRQQTRTLAKALEATEGPELGEVFSVSLSLLSIGIPSGMPFYANDRRHVVEKFQESRLKLWEAIRSTLEAVPSLAEALDERSSPFGKETEDLARRGFPSESAWESLVQEARMSGALRLAPEGPKAKNRIRL